MAVYNGDCLEVMRDFSANSIDLLFCDLPYGETACKWDCKIDLETFWKEVNRICKINCPMFFTTTTRFGVELINSNPKNFRYDLVWVKSASVGFLNAKKMPMRKHELIYVFYRKLPYYDLSSHKHKFLGHTNIINPNCYNKLEPYEHVKYDPPLPNSVIKTNLYANNEEERSLYRNDAGLYDPPLPVSVLKEEKCYGEGSHNYEYKGEAREANVYEPPLPVSVIRNTTDYTNNSELYGKIDRPDFMRKNNEGVYDPPLPNSVLYPNVYIGNKKKGGTLYRNEAGLYDPPLPNSILEVKSEKGKHATQKPTELLKWILKYYSKEGDTVLDPTMGSGTTGVACKLMNRNFIGIEKDEKIYKDAVERINKI